MAINTTHIREMLAQAIDACEKAEQIDAEIGVRRSAEQGGVLHSEVARMRNDIDRLLKGAAVHAIHSYAELQDERFLDTYGDDGYTR